MPTCPSCQKHVEATWKVCPFCEIKLESSLFSNEKLLIQDTVMVADKIEIRSGNTSLECPQCKDEGNITLSVCKTCENKFCQSCKAKSVHCERCATKISEEKLKKERQLYERNLRIQHERHEKQMAAEIEQLHLKQEELSEKIKTLNEEQSENYMNQEKLAYEIKKCEEELVELRTVGKQKLLDDLNRSKSKLFDGMTIQEHEESLENIELWSKWETSLAKIFNSEINKNLVIQMYIASIIVVIVVPILYFWAGTLWVSERLAGSIYSKDNLDDWVGIVDILIVMLDIVILSLFWISVWRITRTPAILSKIARHEEILNSHEVLTHKQELEEIEQSLDSSLASKIDKINSNRKSNKSIHTNVKSSILVLDKEIEKTELELRETLHRLKILTQ